jgi:hypothetical protein
LSLQ